MTTVRKTVKWVIVLVLAATGAAGAYAVYLWNSSDELLRQTVLERFHEIAPDWNIDFRRARFDFLGRIHLHDVSLKGADGSSPLLDIAEAIFVVDREQLAEPQPAIHQIRLVRPRASLVRELDGTWNFQQLPPIKLPKGVLPEFDLDQLSISISLAQAEGGTSPLMALDKVKLQLVPSGRRQYHVRGSARFDKAEAISVEGDWQLDERAWNMGGEFKNLRVDATLLELIAAYSPEFHGGLRRLAGWAAASGGGQAPAAGTGGVPATARLDAFGLEATADVTFHVTQWQSDAEREFKVQVRILDGEIARPPVPFPCRELRGTIDFDNQQIQFEKFSLKSGSTRLKIDQGKIMCEGALRPADFDLSVTDLPLDERLPGILPQSIRTVYQEAQATGWADLNMHLEYNGRDRWDHDCELFVRDGSVTHVKFPYRVERVEGTIVKRGDMVDVSLKGVAGQQPITLAGRVKNPGPAAATVLDIESQALAIDEKLRSACPDRFRKVLDFLQVEGALAVKVRLVRSPGPHQLLKALVSARLRNGTLNCKRFPYLLTDVSGEFKGAGLDWEFSKCRGRHGAAEIKFGGDFKPDEEGRSLLKLNFNATSAVLDRQLMAALPDDWQAIWREFSPAGGIDADGQLLWTPGAAPAVQFEAHLTDASLTLKSFPFGLEEVQAKLDVSGGHVQIVSLSGRHDETRFRAVGTADYFPDGEWGVRLNKLEVDDLEADRTFRKALPPRLRGIVDVLDPRGRQSISGMLEFRGRKGDDTITAAWDTVTVYTGTTLTAGVDLKEVHGKAHFRGTWDGEAVTGDGRIDLDSVRIAGYQLSNVRGPVSIDGTRLILGSKDAISRTAHQKVDNSRRVTAQFIEGTLALDAIADLGDPLRYHLQMELSNGELRRYAQLYMPGNNKLAGVTNGWVDLSGEGADPKRLTGSGQLTISPAALYELPVIVAIFKVLSFVPPDKTAFNQARFQFEVRDSLVLFKLIDLVGNAINLVGHGTVRFNGNLNLDFLSTMGRNQLPIPIVRELIKEATKGWVGVHVGGTLKSPDSVVRPFAQMDDALRKLLGVFEPKGPARR